MTKNIDKQEIAKFSDLAVHWWDTQGKLKTLHAINPLRLRFIQDRVDLANKKIIDIGCGAGILTESLASAGGVVTGIDMSESTLKIAKLHQLETQVQVDYLLTTAEAIANDHSATYDVVTCMELLEHVPDPAAILHACSILLKPGGHAFFSTLNRNLKSYLYAIVGAEYILNLLPKNTHDYAKFIRPSELTQWSKEAGLIVKDLAGIRYSVLNQEFSLCHDVSVNYLVYARKK